MLKSPLFRLLAVLFCLLLAVSAATADGVEATLTTEVSVWNPGEDVPFTGTIRHPGTELNGVTLKLEVQTEPDAPKKGTPLITGVNGVEVDPDWWESELSLAANETQGDISFEVLWLSPAEPEYGVVTVTLSVVLDDQTIATASCEVRDAHAMAGPTGITIPLLAGILLGIIAAVTGVWFLLHRKPNREEEIRKESGWRDRFLDTVIIVLFFLGVILTPMYVRVAFIYKEFRSIGYMCYLNFPCTLAVLLSFLRLKKWKAADLFVFTAWLLLLIPMFISNRDLEYTRYVTIPFQNLLPVYFVFYRMNRRTKEKTIHLFLSLFNCFVFILLAFAIEEKITGKAVVKALAEHLVAKDMYATDLVRFLIEPRFFSFWGHPLTNALLFNSFLGLNAAWYKTRGKQIYALLYVPVAMAGVLLSGSKTGITVCFLLLIVICWKYKKWLLAAIPIVVILYFAGAFNSIIYRFTHTSLTTGRVEALTAYFTQWYSQYPLKWLNGYSSNIVLDPGYPLYSLRPGFEFPVLMFAFDYGIIFSVVLMAGFFLYISWRCLRKKQWVIWLCFTLVFAEINTYNAFALRNQDVFIIGCFVTMLMLNMIPEEKTMLNS